MSLITLKNFFSDLSDFVKKVSADERIPARDKKVIVALVALIISPIDIIPDWIPIIGVLDDLIILAIVLDYLFNVLDQNILLSHYPWGMKSYTWIRRAAKTVTGLTPGFIKKWIWKYKPEPY
ncbi:MAG: DUF1232 domain-containing protein [Bdellovibrionales bacterium]|nr:DUF1232 domain-containing protein [Bdellovibrionales bacterium]